MGELWAGVVDSLWAANEALKAADGGEGLVRQSAVGTGLFIALAFLKRMVMGGKKDEKDGEASSFSLAGFVASALWSVCCLPLVVVFYRLPAWAFSEAPLSETAAAIIAAVDRGDTIATNEGNREVLRNGTAEVSVLETGYHLKVFLGDDLKNDHADLLDDHEKRVVIRKARLIHARIKAELREIGRSMLASSLKAKK